MPGDDFKPHPNLEPFFYRLEGHAYFDSLGEPRASTVLLIHGNGDEVDSWRHVFAALSARHRVIALDLPGFGRSRTTGDGSIANLASSVQHLLELLGVRDVHLVGSSLGAVVAARVAARQPRFAQSLTIIGGSSPALGGLQANAALQPLLEIGTGEAYYTGLRGLRRQAAFDSLRPYYAALDAMPAADLEFLRERVWARVWSDTQRTAFFAALRDLFNDTAPLELSVIPTLLIWGEFDQIVPINYAHAILEQVPHASLEVIAGSGHLPQQERPLTVLRALEDFLLSF